MLINLDYEKISKNHLQFCLLNQNLFVDKNFSIIQYIHPNVIDSHFDLHKKIYNKIAKTPRNYTFLNLGMGGGFLEYYVKNHGKINLESAEWDQQEKQFSVLRNEIGVDDQLAYICSDIRSDDFEIFDCNKTYDYIILTRFFPLNKLSAPNLDDVKVVLNRLEKYSNKFIIFDSFHNYTKEVIEFFESKKDEKIQLPKLSKEPADPSKPVDFNHWIIEL
jgi:hypothetical protein